MAKFDLFYPVGKPNLRVTNPFGANPTVNGRYIYKDMGMIGHNGIDIWATDGTPVYAAHDGIVSFASYDSNGGLGVVLLTKEPFEYVVEGEVRSSYFKSIYWHLKEGSIKVALDQDIKAGDLLGLADNTGVSNGNHLHFGLKPCAKGENKWTWMNSEQDNGYFGAIDPAQFWNRFYAQDAKVALGIMEKMVNFLSQAVELAKAKKINL